MPFIKNLKNIIDCFDVWMCTILGPGFSMHWKIVVISCSMLVLETLLCILTINTQILPLFSGCYSSCDIKNVPPMNIYTLLFCYRSTYRGYRPKGPKVPRIILWGFSLFLLGSLVNSCPINGLGPRVQKAQVWALSRKKESSSYITEF